MSFQRESISSRATIISSSNQDTVGFAADDDYASDNVDAAPVDLSAFLGTSLEELVDIENDEDENEDEDDEEEDQDEEEEEFETDEDEEGDELEPGDELLQNTLSQEELKRQREYNKSLLKEKKRALIDEYIMEMKNFTNVRAKNTFLMLKLSSQVGKKQAIVDKYTDLEKSNQEYRRKSMIAKRKRIQEECHPKSKTQPDPKQANQLPPEKYKRKKRKTKKRTMFEEDNKLLDILKGNTPVQSKRNFSLDVNSTVVPSVELRKLKKKYAYNTTPVEKRHGPRRSSLKNSQSQNHPHPLGKQPHHGINAKHARVRESKKIVDFSFRRSKFMKDIKKEPTKEEEMLSLDINIDTIGKKEEDKKLLDVETYAPLRKSLNRRQSLPMLNARTLSVGKVRTGRFAMTEEAVGISKSKARMSLAVNRLDRKVQHEAADVTTENLHHFKFEFADPRLTAKQASTKIRTDLMRLLKHRHIPTSHLTWPMEIKGVNFTSKNPFGRVALNYTKPTMKESEHPHTHYRMLLTNIAYLRTKEEKMKKRHSENMVDFEEERIRLSSGVQRIFNEVIEGLRIWASLSGYSSEEKRDVMRDTELFIEHLKENVNEKFFSKMLIDLHREIISTEFALRRLSLSEGKGEGAELHEFKDIMRCREKLKAEHLALQQSIEKYQYHTKEILQNIRYTDSRKQELTDVNSLLKEDVAHLTTALSTMIDAMHFVHYLSKAKIKKELWMKSEIGLHGIPMILDDYYKVKKEVMHMKFVKSTLKRRHNACIREIHKLKPVPQR
ncbi:unnamed protein product [Orchesella dallaii]|uniref:Uncharacterized protein n=1 Tax=Orchesella dallaii TaxID=48710 RepID=A0ABP1QI72_9HEXA